MSTEALTYLEDSVDSTSKNGLFLVGYDADTPLGNLMKELADFPVDDLNHIEFSGLSDAFFTDVTRDSFMVGKGGMTAMALDTASTTHFTAAFKAHSGEDSQNYVPQTYDGIYMAAIAVALSGADFTDGEKIKNNLQNKTASGKDGIAGGWGDIDTNINADGEINYVGASGPLDFDANGDVSSYYQHQEFNSAGAYTNCGCWDGAGVECDATKVTFTACAQ